MLDKHFPTIAFLTQFALDVKYASCCFLNGVVCGAIEVAPQGSLLYLPIVL